MKKIYFISLFTLTFILTGTLRSQTASWSAQVSGTTQHLFGIYAFDANTCYVAGYDGTILKTINGGTTWGIQTSGVFSDLYDTHFTSATTGYVVGDSAKALKTIDGGATWTQMSVGVANTVNFRNVHFITATTGFIVGGKNGTGAFGTILKTTDGGTTWVNTTIGTVANYGICFTSATTGYITNFIGQVHKTTNGGTTWGTSSTGVSVNLSGIGSTTSGSAIFAVGTTGNIRKSIDAGVTWTTVTSGSTADFVGIDFYDANNGVITGGIVSPSSALILTTTDGGATWIPSAPAVPRLTKVDLLNANIGYAVGLNGTIIKYNSNVGINELSADHINFPVFPNPFSTSATVDCSAYNFSDKPLLELYDITGKLIRKQDSGAKNSFTIEKNELAAGAYFYVIFDGEQRIDNGKIIIQ